MMRRASVPIRSPRHLAFPSGWFVLMALTLGLSGCGGEGRPEKANARFEIFPPTSSTQGAFQLSPDGRHIVVATKNRLWVRSLSSLRFEALSETDGARLPFWAPDSQSMGFFAGGTLKRVALSGGAPVTVCPAADPRGGTWGGNDVIVFAAGGASSGLFRVAAGGDQPVALALFADGDAATLSFPEFLPDGRHILFLRESPSDETSGVYVAPVDGPAPVRVLADRSTVALAAGQVLFRRDGALMAQPFDVTTRQVSGAPRLVAQDVDETVDGHVAVSGSLAGAIAFRPGARAFSEALHWVDGTGRVLGTVGRPGRILAARVSADMQRLAFVTGDGPDLWLQDLPSGPVTHAGAGPVSSGVAWNSGADRVAIGLIGPPASLTMRGALPPHADVPFPTTGFGLVVNDWSADGRWLVFEQDGGAKQTDLWLLPLLAQGTPMPFAYTDAREFDAVYSPDGRWLAYVRSDGEGANVFVQSAPVPGSPVRVSPQGGVAPRWRPDGGEIYFQAPDDTLMSARITLASSIDVGAIRPLFDLGASRFLQAAPEGRRFLVASPEGADRPLTLIRHWTPDAP